MKLNESDENELILLYTDKHARVSDIAALYGVTRQAVWKVLKRHNIDTSKDQRVERPCRTCGAPVLRRRAEARKTNASYCSVVCYQTFLAVQSERYKPSDYYSRMTHKEVERLFPTYNECAGYSIHYVNGDRTDFRPANLEVYASQSDHLRKHRGQDIQPIWRGVDVKPLFSTK